MIVAEEAKLARLQKISFLTSDVDQSIELLKVKLKSSKEKEKKLLNQWEEYKLPLQKELNEVQRKIQSIKVL